MFETGVTDLLELLLRRKPFQPFSVELVGGAEVKISKFDQARVDGEAGLMFLREWKKDKTTAVVLSRIAVIHTTGQV